MMLTACRRKTTLVVVFLAAVTCLPAAAQWETSYSFLKAVDGSATIIQETTGTRVAAQVHQPILKGDRLWVPGGNYGEVVLSDRNLLRMAGDAEVVFERLAFSPESQDRSTVLRLLRGRIQLVVTDHSLGDEFPVLVTPNSTVYIQDRGSYRIEAQSRGWSEVVVRQGYVEVLTERGSLLVRAGEGAWIEGEGWVRTEITAAGPYDSLERWAGEQDRLAAESQVPYVDESLAYSAAPLSRHGTWVPVGGTYAWRPHVTLHWRPYWHGRWTYTPLGLSWISYEPWGWVPYHFGTWDFVPGLGWVWFPGTSFAPAWVYWYWGPHFVGWVPVGYYTHYYAHRFSFSFGFRYGFYGWAGGHWRYFANWTFCPLGYLGSSSQHHHVRSAGRFRDDVDVATVPPGLITTDTRPMAPERWQRPREILELARRSPGGAGLPGGAELPDVTPFVARRPDLPPTVTHAILTDRPQLQRLTGTPLVPHRGEPVPRVPPAASGLPEVARPAEGSPRTPIHPRPVAEDRPAGRPQGAPSPPPVVGDGRAPGQGGEWREVPRPGSPGRTPPDSRLVAPRPPRPQDRPHPMAIPAPEGRTSVGRPQERPALPRPQGSQRPQEPATRPPAPEINRPPSPPAGRTPPVSGLTSAGDRTPVVRRVIEGIRPGRRAPVPRSPAAPSVGSRSPSSRRPGNGAFAPHGRPSVRPPSSFKPGTRLTSPPAARRPSPSPPSRGHARPSPKRPERPDGR